MTRPPDESNIGAWLFVALIFGINVAWISIDLWLHAHHHEYLTTEFREGLKQPLIGFLLAFFTFGTIAGLIWHFFIQRDQ